MIAAHDTYGINFRIDDVNLDFYSGERRTKCPLYNGTWQAVNTEYKRVTDGVAQSVAQSPIAFRETCETTVAIGSRPGDLGFENGAAADFCTKFMS